MQSILDYMQSKSLNVTAVPQQGQTCKIVAISCVDAYWAKKKQFKPIYPRKNRKEYHEYTNAKHESAISTRQIAKKYRSVQGELLEKSQFIKIFKDIGYQATATTLETEQHFQQLIKKNIDANKPLLICFAVDASHQSTQPSIFSDKDNNEHAAVISGYKYANGKFLVECTHWGQKYSYSITELYNSICSLPAKREFEQYNRTKTSNKASVYRILETGQQASADTLQTIIPKENTGFKNLVFTIDEPVFDYRNICNKEITLMKEKTNYRYALSMLALLIIPTIALIVIASIYGFGFFSTYFVNTFQQAPITTIACIFGITVMSAGCSYGAYKATSKNKFFSEKVVNPANASENPDNCLFRVC